MLEKLTCCCLGLVSHIVKVHMYIVYIGEQMNKHIASRDSHFIFDIVSHVCLKFVTDHGKTNGEE